MINAGFELPEAAIAEICRRHQVRELSLFGSAARGEMRSDSDIARRFPARGAPWITGRFGDDA